MENLTTETNKKLKAMKEGNICEVKISGKWYAAAFISFDGTFKTENGEQWDKFSAFVPGFNGSGVLTSLRGGYNIR